MEKCEKHVDLLLPNMYKCYIHPWEDRYKASRGGRGWENIEKQALLASNSKYSASLNLVVSL